MCQAAHHLNQTSTTPKAAKPLEAKPWGIAARSVAWEDGQKAERTNVRINMVNDL